MHQSRLLFQLVVCGFVTVAAHAYAEGDPLALPKADLVSDATIKKQKDLTKTLKLNNGIPVIIRQEQESDIVQLGVIFHHGLRDLVPGKKALSDWLWRVLPMAATDVPKALVFNTIEKYGLEMDCQGGIEVSQCALGTLNDFWDQALPLVASLVQRPAFTDEDVKLSKDRSTAHFKNMSSDPGSYVNEVVNSVYYPAGHPYRLGSDEALAELAKLTKADLVALHQTLLNANRISLVVVSSLPQEKLIQDLNAQFGKIPAAPTQTVKVQDPVFGKVEDAYKFYERQLPTAYIRIKMPAPSLVDKDSIATRFMFQVLAEEMEEEIRTKRSLSYAVHAFVIQYNLGIGVLSVSTAKPKETLDAIETVLQHIKTKTMTRDELEEYKHLFATSYYLTQETHASLAGALANSYNYFKSADEIYDLPRKLDLVTAEDIKRLANAILKDFRMGVIFSRSEFKDEWAKEFIARHHKA